MTNCSCTSKCIHEAMTDDAAMTALMWAVELYGAEMRVPPRGRDKEKCEAVRQAAIAYGDQRYQEGRLAAATRIYNMMSNTDSGIRNVAHNGLKECHAIEAEAEAKLGAKP